MKARLEDKFKAIELRKKGLSYKEIQQLIPVSKGLLSGWLKYIKLSKKEEEFLKNKIKEKQDAGRLKTMFTNRARRMVREKIAEADAEDIFKQYVTNPTFLIGISLYWAEGGKKSGCFQFVNSDPDMILFMYKWVQKFLGIQTNDIKCRLYIHAIPGYEGCEMNWSKKLGIEPQSLQKTIYKKTRHIVKKNPEYQGCFRLNINSIYTLRLMKAWQKLLITYYGASV
jgi:hypothetical protein